VSSINFLQKLQSPLPSSEGAGLRKSQYPFSDLDPGILRCCCGAKAKKAKPEATETPVASRRVIVSL